ncbi:MAG TPA: F0F1 ATP synthase subunit epsilon [Jiangellaceae bacterium]|nr:F0F1 ATP synthase subunit epsilon [Jiangellaceae bacterium]
MAELQVELVAADRKVWSGAATIVITRTTEGEIGIMPGHQPLLGLLITGPVTIRTPDDQVVSAAVHGGFLSIADDVVTILAEVTELADEIDVKRAEAALETAGDDTAATRRAETRLRAAGAR